MTDTALFSRLLRHPARKRSESIFTTRSPHGVMDNSKQSNFNKILWRRKTCSVWTINASLDFVSGVRKGHPAETDPVSPKNPIIHV